MERCTLYDFEKYGSEVRQDYASFMPFRTGIFSENLLMALRGFHRIYNRDIPKVELFLRDEPVLWHGFSLYNPHNDDSRIFRQLFVRPDGEICFICGWVPYGLEFNLTKDIFIGDMTKLQTFLQNADDGKEEDPEFVVDWHGGGSNHQKFSFKLSSIEKIISIAKGETKDEAGPNNPIVTARNDVMQRKAEDLLCRFSEETAKLHVANKIKPSTFLLDETYRVVMNALKNDGNELYSEIDEFMKTAEQTGCFIDTMDEIKREFSSRGFIGRNL